MRATGTIYKEHGSKFSTGSRETSRGIRQQDLININACLGAVLRCFPSHTEALYSRAKLRHTCAG